MDKSDTVTLPGQSFASVHRPRGMGTALIHPPPTLTRVAIKGSAVCVAEADASEAGRRFFL